MNTLRLLLRIPAVPLVILWVGAVWLYDAAREHAKKRRLGPAYEGPLDNPDLR